MKRVRARGARRRSSPRLRRASPAGRRRTSATGCMVCVPVARAVGRRPDRGSVPRPRVEYQLTCPRGYVVGGLDARAQRPRDRRRLPRARSAARSTPGSRTSRPAVVRRQLRRRAGARAELQAARRLHARGGRRRACPTAVTRVQARPADVRRVKTVRVRPGETAVTQRCAARERLVGASHAFGFFTRDAAEREPGREPWPAAQRFAAASVVVMVRADAEVAARAGRRPGARGLREGAMSFQSPWLLLGAARARAGGRALPARRAAADALRGPLHEPRRARVGRRRRAWRRFVPPPCLLLALASLLVGARAAGASNRCCPRSGRR